MKFKIVLIQFIGLLFIVKGFDEITLLLFGKESLEVFRGNSSFSFYSDFGIFSNLFFISAPGLIGLLLGLSWCWFLNKKTKNKKYLLVISTAGVLLLNKLFPSITTLVEFRSQLLSSLSVFTIITICAAISILTGLLILGLQLYLVKLNHYLKVHADQPQSLNL